MHLISSYTQILPSFLVHIAKMFSKSSFDKAFGNSIAIFIKYCKELHELYSLNYELIIIELLRLIHILISVHNCVKLYNKLKCRIRLSCVKPWRAMVQSVSVLVDS